MHINIQRTYRLKYIEKSDKDNDNNKQTHSKSMFIRAIYKMKYKQN